MQLDNNILALVEPTLVPLEIKTPSRNQEGGGEDKITKTFGIESPVVTMNGYVFEKNDINTFRLSNTGIIPTVSITLVDRKNVFTVDSFPRDGDFFTVYVGSKNESTFKSIHLDFDVVDIAASPSAEGDPKKVRISGKLKIPKLDAEECRYLEEGTSLDHLIRVIRELGLGLSSNVDETSDQQVRIQPYITYGDFIDQIVKSSYISDSSFLNYFIDIYYYLNFVDVNRVITSNNPSLEEFQDSFTSLHVSMAEESFADDRLDNTPSKILLTNKMDWKPTNSYIERYTIDNQSKTINEKHGHFRELQIWDDNGDPRLDRYRVEALTTPSERLRDIEEPLKGNRESEEYLSLVKNKYMGRQSVGEAGLGNSHQNGLYAKFHNTRNNDELQKIKLNVTLASFNPSFYRYQKVPVLMYHNAAESIRAAIRLDQAKEQKGFKDSAIDKSRTVEDPQPDQVMDQFLSGYYIIESIDLVYKQSIGNFTQEMTLLRREWPARIATVK
jgi:hypothetical protein